MSHTHTECRQSKQVAACHAHAVTHAHAPRCAHKEERKRLQAGIADAGSWAPPPPHSTGLAGCSQQLLLGLPRCERFVDHPPHLRNSASVQCRAISHRSLLVQTASGCRPLVIHATPRLPQAEQWKGPCTQELPRPPRSAAPRRAAPHHATPRCAALRCAHLARRLRRVVLCKNPAHDGSARCACCDGIRRIGYLHPPDGADRDADRLRQGMGERAGAGQGGAGWRVVQRGGTRRCAPLQQGCRRGELRPADC